MDNLKSRDATKSEIRTFFDGTNVFLTGGTGAVGQVLLEKLLRSCPISNVFLLVRKKKNKSPETRIDELFNMPLFDRLKVVQPNFIRKITLVIGDCEKPDLGLSEEDKALLVARVDVVIHCAATVNFIEPLRRTTFINVRSTRDLLLLARRMNGLKVFVYVSSAYSNCNRNYIDEIIYESHLQGDALIEMAEIMTDSAMNSVTDNLLKDWPNTYTFSKCIAENIVKQYGSGMPVCITRPGIVVSTYSEPIPGWMSNCDGINGVTIGSVIGAIHVVFAKNVQLAVVPSDKVANIIVSSAWHTGVTSINNSIPVFNYVCVNMAPEVRLCSNLDALVNMGLKKKLFPKKQLWYPRIYFTSSKPLYIVLFILLHYIPAFFADIFLRFTSHKISAVRIYKKVYKLQNILSPFTLIEYKFNDHNVMDLISRQTDCDKLLFNMNMVDLKWDSYYENCIRGCMKYVLHESGKPNLEIWRRIFVLHYGLITIMIIIMFYLFVYVLNFIFK